MTCQFNDLQIIKELPYMSPWE